MIALAAALALASAAAPIPEGAARYRVEIAGVPVGAARLDVSCRGERCTARWRSALRLPAAAGGRLRTRRIEARVDRAGALGDVVAEVDGVRVSRAGPAGAVPLALVELVLVVRRGGCVPVLDEESGGRGTACGTVEEDGGMRIEVPGALEDVTPGRDGFPEVVDVAAQGTRFVRDPAAEVPVAAPPLEVRVPGPAAAAARRFCGRQPDPPAPAAGLSGFPEPRPDGRSCREQARAYAEAVRRRGLPARVAVGVAHDGRGFVWHAWVEVRSEAGWVAVDPAFGELPARGPRFTVARHDGDAAGVAEAGRHILACWGRARVE